MNYANSLLSQMNTIIKEQARLSYPPLSEYNIFNILNVTAKEATMCRFLADLLDPEGAHKCGILFLKSFLQTVLKETRINNTLLTHTNVIRELVIDDARRIDIAIDNAQFFIPIEVKIYAEEQEGQCYDYYTYAKKFDQNTQIVYLTRFGNSPSEYSRKNRNGTELLSNNKITCISWERDICGWLNGLIAEITEPIKSMIIQYIDAIHCIADSREDRIMEKSLELLYKSSDFFSAGLQIEKSMKIAKIQLIRLVFDDFKKEMEQIAPKYGLALEAETNYYFYNEKRHEKFYDRDSTYPGLNYIVKNAKFYDSNLQMWFRIEIEHNLFAGFCLFDTKAGQKEGEAKGHEVAEITDELITEAAQYLEKDIITPVNWWFSWCYSNGKHQDDYYADVPDFMHMNPCAVALVDAHKRVSFVKQTIKIFEECLLRYFLKKQ